MEPDLFNNVIEFIDYTGDYPCLCMGVLTIKVNGKTYELENALVSGGSIWFDDKTGFEQIETGKWKVWENNLPDELLPLKSEIEAVVNEHVDWGCCGGCI